MVAIVVILIILVILWFVIIQKKAGPPASRVVLYSSKDCPLCTEIKEVWSKLEAGFPDIEFKNIDCYKNKEAAHAAGIRAFPTVIITRITGDHKYLGAWTYDGLYAELSS
jgi:glutaredoxin